MSQTLEHDRASGAQLRFGHELESFGDNHFSAGTIALAQYGHS